MLRSRMLAALAGVALSAVAIVPPARAEPVTIGAIYLDDVGFYAAVRKGIRDAAKSLGRDVNLLETNARADPGAEGSFIDRLISANAKAIVLSAVSADGSVRAIRRAHDAGIPVVCYNTCINDNAMKKYVYAYAVADPKEFGRKLGAVAADYFLKNGIKAPKIGILNCEFAEVCTLRREGFEEALKAKVPDYTIVSNQRGTVLDQAVSVSDQMMSAHPEINAFFGEGGEAGVGAVRSIKQRNLAGKVVVFSADMSIAAAQELADHTVLKAVADVSGQGIGRLALEQALNGADKKPAASLIVPMTISIFDTTEQAKTWLADHPDGLS
ncbi:substrate-binding domain-containing protein [Methylorubrum podarium]|jgi:sugar transport system substrate-binding protein|uniref:substrate-binding domain-containing protein n=1 Tax=Methylorubrum podarium TaxID=200476 RepID=UPI001EE2FCE5|nr:substrate-binding domain-containing protein [Methylorubrum podarium]GJE69446.1 ABC transporter periplasmic-binding protein YphF [Methylorubrum podarium]